MHTFPSRMYVLIASLILGVFFVQTECYLTPDGLCTTREVTCASSCTSLAFCSEHNAMPLLQGCYGSTPYCFMGQCVNSYNPRCNQPNNPLFICPEQDGTYPDPHDCTRFHICLNRRPYSSYCNRQGLVFSTDTLSCVRESNEHQCGKALCGKNNTWVQYSADPRYAFYCNESTSSRVIRCKENYVFNVNNGRCEFKCSKEGLFPDENIYSWYGEEIEYPRARPSYIECSLLYGVEFLMTKRSCPNDQFVTSVFDVETSQCVDYKNYTTPTSAITTTSPIPV